MIQPRQFHPSIRKRACLESCAALILGRRQRSITSTTETASPLSAKSRRLTNRAASSLYRPGQDRVQRGLLPSTRRPLLRSPSRTRHASVMIRRAGDVPPLPDAATRSSRDIVLGTMFPVSKAGRSRNPASPGAPNPCTASCSLWPPHWVTKCGGTASQDIRSLCLAIGGTVDTAGLKGRRPGPSSLFYHLSSHVP